MHNKGATSARKSGRYCQASKRSHSSSVVSCNTRSGTQHGQENLVPHWEVELRMLLRLRRLHLVVDQFPLTAQSQSLLAERIGNHAGYLEGPDDGLQVARKPINQPSSHFPPTAMR